MTLPFSTRRFITTEKEEDLEPIDEGQSKNMQQTRYVERWPAQWGGSNNSISKETRLASHGSLCIYTHSWPPPRHEMCNYGLLGLLLRSRSIKRQQLG